MTAMTKQRLGKVFFAAGTALFVLWAVATWRSHPEPGWAKISLLVCWVVLLPLGFGFFAWGKKRP